MGSSEVSVRAQASDAHLATLRIDSQVLAVPEGETSYEATALLTFADGEHTIEAEAVDLAGRTRSVSVSFFVDSHCDFIAIMRPEVGALLRESQVLVSGVVGCSSATGRRRPCLTTAGRT